MKTGSSKPEGNYFEASDGHRLFYEDALGDRDSSAPLTVLFLHGVHESADTLTAQRLLEGVIARGHRFVALEQHGHGRSSGPRGLVQSMSTLVRHATEFVHFLMLAGSRVVVIGHSMGGAVAAFMGSTLRQQYGGCFLGVLSSQLPPSSSFCLPLCPLDPHVQKFMHECTHGDMHACICMHACLSAYAGMHASLASSSSCSSADGFKSCRSS